MSHRPVKPAGRKVVALLVATFLLAALSACRNENPAELMRSGRDYQSRGDHQAAIIQFKNILQKQPENGEARLLLGQSALVVGDPLTAEKEFRKALEYGQPRSVVLPQLARAMLDVGEVDKVVSEFRAVKLDDAPAEAELRTAVGEAQIRLRKFEDAKESFAAALAVDPKSVGAQLGRVQLLAIEGKLDEAKSDIDAIVQQQPDSADALRLQAEVMLASGDRAGGRAALERAVSANPTLASSRFALIGLLIADGQFDAAIVQIDAARTIRGNDPRLLYFEALAAVGKQDFTKARELSQQLLKKAPDHVPSLVVAGGVELQEKQFTIAESYLQKALVLMPQHSGARTLLTRTYLASKQPARAFETIQPLLVKGAKLDAPTLMLVGETYLANGDLKQASTYFESAAGSKDQEPLARVRLSQIALASGDLEGGIKGLEDALAAENAPLQAQLSLISGYMRQGKNAKALEVSERLVKQFPGDPVAYQVLASVQVARKDNSAARAAFAKALELNPAYLPAADGLARLDLIDRKPADARRRFESVVEREPKNELALLGLAEVMAKTNAPPADVIAVLKRAVAAKPDSVRARVALVTAYLFERDARAALTAAQEAAAALPNDSRVLDALGRAQLAAGETNQAIETFNRLAAAEPKSAAPLTRLASVYAARKEMDKAVDALQRAQKLAPGDTSVARDLVLGYLMTGKVDEALKLARSVQTASPKSAAGFALEGDIYATTRQWPQAERAYREALKAEPGSEVAAIKLHGILLLAGKKPEAEGFARKWQADHPSDVQFRTYLAEQALRARDFKTAAGLYQAVIAQQPDNTAVLNNLAWTLGQLGDSKALGIAERAYQLAPNNPLVLDTYGVLLVGAGNSSKGIEYLARAVSLAPERPDIRLNYAKALLKAGKTEEARKELRELQGVTKDFAGKAEVAELLKE